MSLTQNTSSTSDTVEIIDVDAFFEFYKQHFFAEEGSPELPIDVDAGAQDNPISVEQWIALSNSDDEVWLNILGHYVCMPFATTAFGPTSGTGRPAPSAGQLSRSNLLETNCWSRHWLSISRDLDFGLKPALVAMTGRGSYLGSLSKRGAS
ncbi:hypothetical protein C8J57DRAFT_1240925 [Mycena rebaudengoi]|nr:hypothetical protein C8J57DRAFT_1240925 [Mycena rebaudengoi]